jgi:hypothetical protein
MMLERYRARVRKIDRWTAAKVIKQLRIMQCKTGRDALFRTLDANGFDQADLVLCLLQQNTPRTLLFAELLIGHYIKHYPPAFKWRPVPVNVLDRKIVDSRRVLRVQQEPRLRSGRLGWLPRYHLFKVGLSVTQLLRRGVTAKDLRLVAKRGWVEFTPA